MKNCWKKERIGDLTTKINSGATPRGGKESYKETGISLIRSMNVYDNQFDTDGLALIDDTQAEELSNAEVTEDDVLLNITGASVARCCMVPKNILPARVNQHVSIIRTDSSKLYAKFLMYSLIYPTNKQRLLSIAQGGATREALTKEKIQRFEIETPLLESQKRIASILSAYDDLIENNTRRIKILEEMARLIYREWFVEFKAPGIILRKATPEEKKVTGKNVFPEGWEIGIVNDLLSFKSGFAFKSGTFTDSGRYALVTIKNVQDGLFIPETTSRLDEIPENMPDYCIIESGDILMSLTGNIGRVCLTYGNDLLLNQRVSKIVPLRKEDKAISYCLFRQTEMQRKLEMIANGVAQQNLSPVETGRMAIAIPSKEIRDKFNKIVQPLLEMIVQLYQKNSNLRQTRDLVLPKLISGEVEV